MRTEPHSTSSFPSLVLSCFISSVSDLLFLPFPFPLSFGFTGLLSFGVVAGGTVSGGLVAGRPVAGRPVSGCLVAGSPVSGCLVAGGPVSVCLVAGRPVAGGPVSGCLGIVDLLLVVPCPKLLPE